MKRSQQLIAALTACSLALSPAALAVKGGIDRQQELPPAPQVHTGPVAQGAAQAFSPPAESSIPDNEFGRMVRRGKEIFMHTDRVAAQYVGNGMKCVNCHLDRGRLANSAPLWAAWPMYPAFRKKNNRVNTMAERIQGCFTYSMNGSPPPADSETMVALLSYHYWLAQGAPTGVQLPGRGYPKLADPSQEPSVERGRAVYQSDCALCHGAEGQGQKVDGSYVFPPLWGPDSYNWGAGMHRINTAASFIKANMPLGLGGERLSEQQAWDVAAYINSHPRPQDPRFQGDLGQTKQTFHNHMCRYGEEVEGKRLGAQDR